MNMFKQGVYCISKKSFSAIRQNSNQSLNIHIYLRYYTCLNQQCIYVHSEKLNKILSKFRCCFHEILHLNPVTQAWLPVCLHISQAPEKQKLIFRDNTWLWSLLDFSTVGHGACTTTPACKPELTFLTKTRICNFPMYFIDSIKMSLTHCYNLQWL